MLNLSSIEVGVQYQNLIKRIKPLKVAVFILNPGATESNTNFTTKETSIVYHMYMCKFLIIFPRNLGNTDFQFWKKHRSR